MAPFKAYVLGVPIILGTWQTSFQEPDPRGWSDRDRHAYEYVMNGIFSRLEIGFAVAFACLLIGVLIARRTGDRESVTSGSLFLVLVMASLGVLLFSAATR